MRFSLAFPLISLAAAATLPVSYLDAGSSVKELFKRDHNCKGETENCVWDAKGNTEVEVKRTNINYGTVLPHQLMNKLKSACADASSCDKIKVPSTFVPKSGTERPIGGTVTLKCRAVLNDDSREGMVNILRRGVVNQTKKEVRKWTYKSPGCGPGCPDCCEIQNGSEKQHIGPRKMSISVTPDDDGAPFVLDCHVEVDKADDTADDICSTMFSSIGIFAGAIPGCIPCQIGGAASLLISTIACT